jgi:putative glycosyltransferase (TIGR04372 family)
MLIFLRRQYNQIHKGGKAVFFYKLKKTLHFIAWIPLYIISFPVLIFIRILSPILIIRIGELQSSRIGHLGANTELYLCEKAAGINVPLRPFYDIFYCRYLPLCNEYFVLKWKSVINIGPRWLIHPLNILNDIIPFGKIHKIGNNLSHDRDVCNLLDKFPPHLSFTAQEEVLGKRNLELMGLPSDSKFVCLLVRDAAYLDSLFNDTDWSYHSYRDCNIQNYLLAANELTKRGYYVIRMGVKVNTSFGQGNSMIIDYANNGMRSEFMDIFLGAKCEFCISTSSGWDAVPLIFRKPILYAPIVPLGYFFTFSKNFYGITKHHIDSSDNHELTFSEIFERNVGFATRSDDFFKQGVILVENTPQEICDLVVEFVDKISGRWKCEIDDDNLQNQFWRKFITVDKNLSGLPLHGEIRSKFGTKYLRLFKHLLK